jgi:hypothetical protein
MHIKYKKNRAKKNRFCSGVVSQQVAGQEGVAGGANLLRWSAQEMQQKINCVTHEGKGSYDNQDKNFFFKLIWDCLH